MQDSAVEKPSLLSLPLDHPYRYERRKTRVVMVGHVGVGGLNPIRVQSMTTTPTQDTDATVDQVKRLADVGCEIARITAPTVIDAKNLENIKNRLLQDGYKIPLVADIHFRPDAAMEAANFVEKVRVNPGNFVDGKAFKIREYTDEQYDDELKRLEDKFTPLVLKLKRLGRALRIGTNHGSLSDRIMNRFGDTPLGMVESALEFVRICRKNDYHDVIFSMKASNPRVMISAYRLLATRLDLEGMNYPFHLGVTEAGFGEDGRIKSAIGIGALLEDGIGDTIRVSLTEDPELEIPVAQELARRYSLPRFGQEKVNDDLKYVPDALAVSRRVVDETKTGSLAVGAASPIRIVSKIKLDSSSATDLMALMEKRVKKDTPPEIIIVAAPDAEALARYQQFRETLKAETNRLAVWVEYTPAHRRPFVAVPADGYVLRITNDSHSDLTWVSAQAKKLNVPLILLGNEVEPVVMAARAAVDAGVNVMVGLIDQSSAELVYAYRWMVARMNEERLANPILIWADSGAGELGTAAAVGSLICDGIGDAIALFSGTLNEKNLDYAYNFLQACGNRLTKTDYVSCPSCGRTLFDLQSTTERIKSKTGHLKGVRIAIMGCIVNGPGEMADADFGYVGGGPGKINLYVGKNCVEKSIPAEVADEKLVALIKANGKWIEP